MGKFIRNLYSSDSVVQPVSVVGCRTRRQLNRFKFNSYRQVRFVLDEGCRPNTMKTWSAAGSSLSSDPCCTTFYHTCNKIFRTKSKTVLVGGHTLTAGILESENHYQIYF